MDTEAIILNRKYKEIVKILREKNLTISLAESIHVAGSAVSQLMNVEGTSEVLKTSVTACTDETYKQFGIVKSDSYLQTTEEVAKMCREKWEADIGVCISSPDCGSFSKVDNAVYISIAYGSKTYSNYFGCKTDKMVTVQGFADIMLDILKTEDILKFKISQKYEKIVQSLRYHKLRIAAMESCTGGYIASCITDVEGASEVIGNSFVTYTNDAKINQGVPEKIIEEYGVYSAETAEAMAEAATNGWRDADIGIGITGTIGRIDPANKDSVADTVYVCVKFRNNEVIDTVEMHPGSDSRTECKKILAAAIADIIIRVLSSVTLHI